MQIREETKWMNFKIFSTKGAEQAPFVKVYQSSCYFGRQLPGRTFELGAPQQLLAQTDRRRQ
jgi:hypothetical protein